MGGLKVMSKVEPSLEDPQEMRWLLGGGTSVCTRQCSALQEAWGGGGYLSRRGRGWGRENNRSQETSREGWGWAVHPEGVEAEWEAGLRLWGPSALWRPKGEAVSAVWEQVERQAPVSCSPYFSPRGPALARMQVWVDLDGLGQGTVGQPSKSCYLVRVLAGVAWGVYGRNPAFLEEPFQSSDWIQVSGVGAPTRKLNFLWVFIPPILKIFPYVYDDTFLD